MTTHENEEHVHEHPPETVPLSGRTRHRMSENDVR